MCYATHKLILICKYKHHFYCKTFSYSHARTLNHSSLRYGWQFPVDAVHVCTALNWIWLIWQHTALTHLMRIETRVCGYASYSLVTVPPELHWRRTRCKAFAMMNWNSTWLVQHAARMWDTTNAHNISFGKYWEVVLGGDLEVEEGGREIIFK